MKEVLKHQLIGWRGVEFQVPEEWRFESESGNRRVGCMVFVSASSRFEIQWERPKRPIVTEELSNNFIEKMQRNYAEFEILTKDRTEVFRHETILIQFRCQISGYALVWYCGRSKRNFTGLYTFKSTEKNTARHTFDRVFNSIVCHSRDGWITWSFFDISLRTPLSFQIKGKKILSGHVKLELYEQQSHLTYTSRYEVNLEYWSVAKIYFKDTYDDLEKWFKKHYMTRFKKSNIGLKTEELKTLIINGHKAKAFTSTRQTGKISQISLKNDTYIWYCPQSNRIYVLALFNKMNRFLFSKTGDDNLPLTFNRILKSVSCHTAQGQNPMTRER